MHSYNTDKTVFLFNGDGSGDVIIKHRCKQDEIEVDKEITVPTQDVIEFVAHLVRNEAISKLEDMDSRELLGLIQSSPVPKFGKSGFCNAQLSRADSDLCVLPVGHPGEHRG